jgi:hypothetical protein
LDEFVTEVAGFTGMGDAHDDQVDCLAYGVTAAGIFTEPDDSYEPVVSGGFGTAGWNERYGGDDYEPPSRGFEPWW